MEQSRLKSGILKFIILFGIEFDVRLYGMITLRKIAFILLIYYWYKAARKREGYYVSKEKTMLVLIFSVMFLYVLLLNRVNDVSSFAEKNAIFGAEKFVIYVLYIIVFPWLLTGIFIDLKDFCHMQCNIMVFQAMVAILGKLNIQFALFINNNFYNDDGRLLDGIMRGVRMPCIGMGGAAASVTLFAGCVCCLYLLTAAEEKRKTQYLIRYFIITFSMIYIGRTGLYFSIALLTGYFFYAMYRSSKMFLRLLGMGLITIGGAALYITLVADDVMKAHYFNWVGEIFTKGIGEGSTIQILADMKIPPLTAETFWGMSIVRGVSRLGTVIQNDSGYIMTYASVGIPVCILLYGTIYKFYLKSTLQLKDKKIRWILLIFLICIIIFEYKEPFIRKTPLLIIFSTMIFLEERVTKLGGRRRAVKNE